MRTVMYFMQTFSQTTLHIRKWHYFMTFFHIRCMHTHDVYMLLYSLLSIMYLNIHHVNFNHTNEYHLILIRGQNIRFWIFWLYFIYLIFSYMIFIFIPMYEYRHRYTLHVSCMKLLDRCQKLIYFLDAHPNFIILFFSWAVYLFP